MSCNAGGDTEPWSSIIASSSRLSVCSIVLSALLLSFPVAVRSSAVDGVHRCSDSAPVVLRRLS